MDIGELIEFGRKRNDDGIRKVGISVLYNRPIVVKSWEIAESRFHDGSGQFATIVCSPMDDGETVRFNTGSRVIIDQLLQVSKSMDSMQCGTREFSCVIRPVGNFVKMYPCKEEEP